ncbi:hypothetical protein SAMN02746041_03258 [Desulfacinum hydrothermale DSM 13146]|uniref:Uncharacterized protein n=1 Tax=Desulfacinum hydrothermale DSM 13146 TaxID=1121390 RepID=A0A1W1XWV6_9BACT|nr:hypothetical protein [Desulfacinum hydrothermale]SMC28470.1 hypothetical protein SAMN02746041_03258 [Desulfacinum hydrothermale DSM 13146]
MRTGRALRVGTTTDMVRQYAAAQGTVTKRQVREALGLSVGATKHAVETLSRQGFLQKIRHGVYVFSNDRHGGQVPPRPAEREERIRRAMRINEKWSVQDIAQQAGTTESYIYKRLSTYRAKGWVRQAGIRKKPNGCVEKLWRLTLAGRDKLYKPVTQQEFKPDPLVLKVVELNRLVCSGLAQHVPEHGEAAKSLCREILESIST